MIKLISSMRDWPSSIWFVHLLSYLFRAVRWFGASRPFHFQIWAQFGKCNHAPKALLTAIMPPAPPLKSYNPSYHLITQLNHFTDPEGPITNPAYWFFILNARDYYLNKMKYLPAKRVWGESSIEGSNPSLSAIYNNWAGFRIPDIGSFYVENHQGNLLIIPEKKFSIKFCKPSSSLLHRVCRRATISSENSLFDLTCRIR